MSTVTHPERTGVAMWLAFFLCFSVVTVIPVLEVDGRAETVEDGGRRLGQGLASPLVPVRCPGRVSLRLPALGPWELS